MWIDPGLTGKHTENDEFSLCKCRIVTGRTHQIRVHMKHIGHPLVSDTKYLEAKKCQEDRQWSPRMFLHAAVLEFADPDNPNGFIETVCPLASELVQALDTALICVDDYEPQSMRQYGIPDVKKSHDDYDDEDDGHRHSSGGRGKVSGVTSVNEGYKPITNYKGSSQRGRSIRSTRRIGDNNNCVEYSGKNEDSNVCEIVEEIEEKSISKSDIMSPKIRSTVQEIRSSDDDNDASLISPDSATSTFGVVDYHPHLDGITQLRYHDNDEQNSVTNLHVGDENSIYAVRRRSLESLLTEWQQQFREHIERRMEERRNSYEGLFCQEHEREKQRLKSTGESIEPEHLSSDKDRNDVIHTQDFKPLVPIVRPSSKSEIIEDEKSIRQPLWIQPRSESNPSFHRVGAHVGLPPSHRWSVPQEPPPPGLGSHWDPQHLRRPPSPSLYHSQSDEEQNQYNRSRHDPSIRYGDESIHPITTLRHRGNHNNNNSSSFTSLHDAAKLLPNKLFNDTEIENHHHQFSVNINPPAGPPPSYRNALSFDDSNETRHKEPSSSSSNSTIPFPNLNCPIKFNDLRHSNIHIRYDADTIHPSLCTMMSSSSSSTHNLPLLHDPIHDFSHHSSNQDLYSSTQRSQTVRNYTQPPLVSRECNSTVPSSCPPSEPPPLSSYPPPSSLTLQPFPVDSYYPTPNRNSAAILTSILSSSSNARDGSHLLRFISDDRLRRFSGSELHNQDHDHYQHHRHPVPSPPGFENPYPVPSVANDSTVGPQVKCDMFQRGVSGSTLRDHRGIISASPPPHLRRTSIDRLEPPTAAAPIGLYHSSHRRGRSPRNDRDMNVDSHNSVTDQHDQAPPVNHRRSHPPYSHHHPTHCSPEPDVQLNIHEKRQFTSEAYFEAGVPFPRLPRSSLTGHHSYVPNQNSGVPILAVPP